MKRAQNSSPQRCRRAHHLNFPGPQPVPSSWPCEWEGVVPPTVRFANAFDQNHGLTARCLSMFSATGAISFFEAAMQSRNGEVVVGTDHAGFLQWLFGVVVATWTGTCPRWCQWWGCRLGPFSLFSCPCWIFSHGHRSWFSFGCFVPNQVPNDSTRLGYTYCGRRDSQADRKVVDEPSPKRTPCGEGRVSSVFGP